MADPAAASAAAAATEGSSQARAASPAQQQQVAAELSAADAILEPSVHASLSAYLSSTGGGAKAAKKAVRLLSSGYRGRGDMLRLLVSWAGMAGVADAETLQAQMQATVQRAVASKFDAAAADKMLTGSTQPPWLDALVADPAWEAPLLRMQERAPNSLFLRLCVSLMAAQRREQENTDSKPEHGSNGAAATPAGRASKPLISAPLRAACLHDFAQFNALLLVMLRGIVAKCVERATPLSSKRKRITADPDSSDALAARVASTELETLVSDFLRLSAQSEWSYLYAQRALAATLANAPRASSFVLARLAQDLSTLAANPPPPPAALLKAAGAEAAPSRNASVAPLDLLLRGVRDEHTDLLQVWQVLGRTDSLSPLDVNKLYQRFQPGVAEPPPVALIRHKQLIRTLLHALFAPNAALLQTPPESRSSTAAGAAASGGSAAAAKAVSDRYKYCYLLAYACCVKDERVSNVRFLRRIELLEKEAGAALDISSSNSDAVSAAAASAASIEKGSFEPTLTALVRFHELASNKSWGLRPNALLRCIHAHLSLPLFACAALLWLRDSQLCSAAFYDTTHCSVVTPFFLSFLGELANRHALLRGAIFATVRDTFHLNPPSMSGFQLIQLKKLLLNLLVHLVHCGTNLPEVLAMLHVEVRGAGPSGSMDHSLIRHFVVQLLWSTGPPYSRAFLEGVLQLLALPQTFNALHSTMQAGMATARLLQQAASSDVTTAAAAAQHDSAGSAVVLLAQAHVPANTPAAKRLLAAAELHGELPSGATHALSPKELEAGGSAMRDLAPSPSPSPEAAGTSGDAEEPASKRARVGASPAPGSGSSLRASTASPSAAIPGSKAHRREEKERLRRAAAEAEQRRREELVRRLSTTVPREPRPLAQLSHAPDVRDGSETAVLDFCSLLANNPDVLRLSPVVAGLQLSSGGGEGGDVGGVVRADQCDAAAAAADATQPMDAVKLQQYLATVKQYLHMQEKQA